MNQQQIDIAVASNFEGITAEQYSYLFEYGYLSQSYLLGLSKTPKGTYDHYFSEKLSYDSLYHRHLRELFNCIDKAEAKGYKELSEEVA